MCKLAQIIGPSASGKSSLLSHVICRGRFAVIDTDEAYRDYTGEDLFSAFARLGSNALRRQYFEFYAALLAAAKQDTLFIVGGTLPMAEGFWATSKERRVFSIALVCAPETSLRRIQASLADVPHAAHPLLATNNKELFVELLVSYRRVYYQPADAIIETDTLKPDEIATIVLRLLGERFEHI